MDDKLRAINKLRDDFARYVARRFDHPDDHGTRDRLQISPDDIGLDLPDLETAYLEAFKAAEEMWSELLAERQTPLCERSRSQTSAGKYY